MIKATFWLRDYDNLRTVTHEYVDENQAAQAILSCAKSGVAYFYRDGKLYCATPWSNIYQVVFEEVPTEAPPPSEPLDHHSLTYRGGA